MRSVPLDPRRIRAIVTGMTLTATLLGVQVLIGSAAAAQEPSPPTISQTSGSSECVGCHADPAIQTATPGRFREGLYVTHGTLAESVHGIFDCTSCHSALTGTMHERRDAAQSSCVRCHPDQAEAFANGMHAEVTDAGPQPTCVTCHGSHGVPPVDTPAFDTRASRECQDCHNEMGDRFFGGNPFGMETHRGGMNVATCSDCHGAHGVLAADDPASPVNRANILETCRQCHTNAPDNFADIRVHVESSPFPSDPRLRMVTLYMLLILVGTFGFFGYHTVLGIKHEWRKTHGLPKVAR